MINEAISHQYISADQAVINEDTIELRVKTARDDVARAVVIYGPRYTSDPDPSATKEMGLLYQTGNKDIFSVQLKLEDTRFRYCFYFEDKDGNSVWFNENGVEYRRPRGRNSGYFQFPIVNKSDLPDFPEWPRQAVFYQIFPDRFFRAGQVKAELSDWGERPERKSFYGGDLAGITEKLDYLQDLGITAIYLTPIFLSPSNHKYNTDDYYQIDPNFGDKETAQKLVDEAHKRGIKIVLDAVFNHTGSNFFAFKDLLAQGKGSRYKDWYYPESFPVSKAEINYQTFATDVRDMPRLNLNNPDARAYFLEVAAYWTKELNLDGWRLDVADEVPGDFWQDFRKEVKQINPEAFIIGEVWYRASRWLQGDQFDSVMNYKLYQDILKLTVEKSITTEEFSARLQNNLSTYRPGVPELLLNLLDSHDTPRLAWNFRDNDFEEETRKIKISAALQFFLPGVPMIYYGTEVGVTGGDDPDSRRTMIWDDTDQDKERLTFYRRIINFYISNTVFQAGTYQEVFVDPVQEILVFARKSEDITRYVFCNFRDKTSYIERDLLEKKIDILSKVMIKTEPDFSTAHGKVLFAGNKVVLPPQEVLVYS
ncbi:MAG: glycoside hydrolase family 13 protein [Bacillota bacterium]